MNNLEKFYPADRQPGTLTGALVRAGHYASAQSARAVLNRAGVEAITLDLSGIYTNPETGEEEHIVVRGVVVERTPKRFLTEKSVARCGSCGQKLTLVRPGKHQCDNEKCPSNV